MVKIRLARAGTTKKPFYRIVAADSRRSRGGKFLEILGTYDPMNLQLSKISESKQARGLVNLKSDRVTYWVSNGAQMSDTVCNILKRAKISTTPKKAA